MNDQYIAAIIPAYNEELTIGTIVLKSKGYVNDVYVVDDGSSDGTARVAEQAGAKVLHMTSNLGKAKAVLTAFSQIQTADYDAVVILDGDGQNDPDDIPLLIGPVLDGSADLVIGSRFIENGGKTPRHRRAGQTVLNKATEFGSKAHVTDSQSGYRALSRQATKLMDFDSDGYKLESDMINHLAERGMRIREVPISANYKGLTRHKTHPVSHGVGVLDGVIGFVGYRRPLLFFGLPGFAMFVAGMIIGFLAVEQVYIWGWLFQSMLAALLVIIGVILGVAGLTLNSMVSLMRSNRLQP